jgi:hypothetical protein
MNLIHNRPYEDPEKMPGPEPSEAELKELIKDPTEVHIGADGRALSIVDVMRNQYKHSHAWKSLAGKFGLVLEELHAVDPKVAAKHLTKSLNSSYIHTHGMSRQLIIRYERFLKTMEFVGLVPLKAVQKEYRPGMVAIAVNWFVPKGRVEEFERLIAQVDAQGARLAGMRPSWTRQSSVS